MARNIAAETGVDLGEKMALSASSATTTASASTASTAGAKAAVAAGGKAASAGLATKIIAGVAAVSVAVGGTVAYQSGKKLPEEPTIAVVSTQAIWNDEVPNGETESADQYVAALENPAQDALACYETFLREGIAQDGFSISHYAILDIDRDGVPELVAADNDGTPETWTSCDLYTYHNNRLRYCGSTSAHYTFFYHVNNRYLLGCHRMGAQYFSPNDFFQTTIYHWNDAGDRNDPAICRNGGEWEYITQEEFEYYNSLTGGFVTESEVITLQENPYRQSTTSDIFLDSSKAWTATKEYDGHNYAATWVFDSDGKYYFLLGEVLSEYYGFYCGSYHVMDDILVLSKWEKDGRRTCAYRWDGDMQLTQITTEGSFFCIEQGETFTLKEDEWNTAETFKGWVIHSVAEDIGTTPILSSEGKYRTCPYYNTETGSVGHVGLDTADGTQFYFSCWIDGVASSAEDFLFEYQEGVTQYTVTGNRNKSAQYELMIEQQNAYVDVTVKRIADEYQVIPEGNYRFYLADHHEK